MSTLLYISMIGESDVYTPGDYTALCPSGLEKDWIVSWHSPLAGRFGLNLTARDICRGDPLPEPDDLTAVILGGTIHLILEDRPWIHALTRWLRAYRKTGKPLLGICGGHQLIAAAFLQWPLNKHEQGIFAGTYPVHLTGAGQEHPLFRKIPEEPRFHFANNYQVFPGAQTGASILAVREGSPVLAADWGGRWFSTQFHPESRLETWECVFCNDPDQDTRAYSDEHCGEQLLENYLNIVQHPNLFPDNHESTHSQRRQNA